MNQPIALYPHKLLAGDFRLQEPEPGPVAETIWRMLWRHRWQCAFVFLGICLLGAATLVLLLPTYTAHTIMAVSSTQTDLSGADRVSPTMRQSGPTEADVESQVQLMTSQRALLKVAQDLDLHEQKGVLTALKDWRGATRTFLLDKWACLVEGDWTCLSDPGSYRPAERPKGPDASTSLEAIVEYMRSHLKVQPIAKSTTIDIAFTAGDAALAATVANAIAENYIEARHIARTEQAGRAAKYLEKRASQLSAEVAAAEKAAEDVRAANVMRDGRDIQQLAAEMEKANTELASARIAEGVARTKLEAAEGRVREFGLVGALEPGQSRLVDRLREMATEARARLTATRTRLGAGHPESQMAEKEYAAAQNEVVFEAQTRMSRLRSDVATAAQQVEKMEAALHGFRQDYDRLSAAALTLKSLERQASASRAIYETFLGRLKETEQVGFNEAQGWVISPALPPDKPSFPNTLQVVGGTFGLGALAALSLALFAEYRARDTVLSSQHVADRGLRPLGIVPDLRRRRSTLRYALATQRQQKNAFFSEAMGSIFTSVMALPHRHSSATVLLITSSLPFEGKSTTVAALAAKIARAEKRVLLIDADLRAPRLHRAFGIKNDRGLSECLEPASCLNDAIYFDAKTGISVLTAGPHHPEPQNVLRSQRLLEFIDKSRASYDYILIDSPPVLPISDARILVPLSDFCIFVARWRKTRWSAATHALELLRESSARIAGIIISKVDVNQLATYGFADSQIYGRDYRRYSTLS